MVNTSEFQKDVMTGAFTREHLVPTLRERIIEAKLRQEKCSILLIDIDHFKEINEKYGHLWGDEFLKFEISTLHSTLRDKGLIFRYGGDEFVVIFSMPNPKEAYQISKQFNQVMRTRPFLFNGRLFRLTISCGLATFPDNAQNAEALIKRADQALYLSKKYGRNTTTIASNIGLEKTKMFFLTLFKLLLIGGLMFTGYSVFIKQNLDNNKTTNVIPSLTKKAFSIIKPNRKIFLKDDHPVKGVLLSEDPESLSILTTIKKSDIRLILKVSENP